MIQTTAKKSSANKQLRTNLPRESFESKNCFYTLYIYKIYTIYIRFLWDRLSYQGIYRRIICDKNNYGSDWKALGVRDISGCGRRLVISKPRNDDKAVSSKSHYRSEACTKSFRVKTQTCHNVTSIRFESLKHLLSVTTRGRYLQKLPTQQLKELNLC